ncbi:STAS domain-containing protein [Noviherbaspirillum sedimenti]|uniref:Anti-sigma factor antagonist n=1 Tax=Noviherbaspirillum sedimenti TaxID=2320865 RepID=A0A3A3FYA2_9BURK|nr:STAS domain-containing protein [Noviherbaspirillum sedimenti]RJG01198.1 anti-sigma factor antagonist [Noviherbaspirillum sedimenti]
MTKAANPDSGASVLRIEGEMSIFRAAELKSMLLASLDNSATLEIDLSAVTEFDTAGVQLLMAAKKAAQARQRELRLTAHSAAVLEVFELFDLGAYFGDPVVIPPQAAPATGRASATASARASNES